MLGQPTGWEGLILNNLFCDFEIFAQNQHFFEMFAGLADWQFGNLLPHSL